MKKLCSLAFVFALIFSLSTVSVDAMDNNRVNTKSTRTNDSINNDMSNYDDAANYRTNNANNYRTNNATTNQAGMGQGNYRANANNNYRATAVDNDRGTDWGWLGLLGLTGLLGLRSRQRERS